MKAYGYRAGYADVTYSWGHGLRGDSCRGRTLVPNHPCQAGFVCVQTDPTGDIPGTCQDSAGPNDVTLGDLLSDPNSYKNQLVCVTSQIDLGIAACTKMACLNPQNPCCNTCNGNMQFSDAGKTLALSGLTCYGNSCSAEQDQGSWQNNCEYTPGAWVRTTGYVRINSFGGTSQVSLEVIDSSLGSGQ